MNTASEVPKVWVGFLAYGNDTAVYLPYFLQSLQRQTHTSIQIVCFDNSPEADNENSRYLKNYPAIQLYRRGDNIGFSAAYNILIAEAIARGAEYFFVVNPDTLLEPDVIDRLVITLERNNHCASVSPKILKWNFKAHIKTSIIDSCGLVLKPGLVFKDLGQGEEDKEQYDQSQILGPSGAAGLFRLSALQTIQVKDNFFDEFLFMYKEDCDLAYRLSLAGYSSQLVSSAIMYHDRTVSGGTIFQRFFSRRQRSKAANRYSFINQHFLYIKYWQRQVLSSKLRIIVAIIMRFLEALLLEQYLLGSYRYIFKGASQVKKY
jgi:GT2 family glycosyltransferase